MSITFGVVRTWRAEPISTAGDELRHTGDQLTRLGEELPESLVPATWTGRASGAAHSRSAKLAASIRSQAERAKRAGAAALTASDHVTGLLRRIGDVEADAASHQFQIGPDGTITDTSEPRIFSSQVEADDYTAERRRIQLRLVADVEAILQAAVELDHTLASALNAGRKKGDHDGADGSWGDLDPKIAAEWAKMSEDERRAVIDELIEEQAQKYGIDVPTIVYANLPPGSYGYWDEDTKTMTVNVNDLGSAEAILDTVVHEMRHAGQYEMARDADPGWLTEIFVNAGLIDDPFQHPGVTQEEAREIGENLEDGNYLSPNDPGVTQEEYENQPSEHDAWHHGGDFIDGLTPEELERLRKEAG